MLNSDMHELVKTLGTILVWGETETQEKQFQRSKSSWILMTKATSG